MLSLSDEENALFSFPMLPAYNKFKWSSTTDGDEADVLFHKKSGEMLNIRTVAIVNKVFLFRDFTAPKVRQFNATFEEIHGNKACTLLYDATFPRDGKFSSTHDRFPQLIFKLM